MGAITAVTWYSVYVVDLRSIRLRELEGGTHGKKWQSRTDQRRRFTLVVRTGSRDMRIIVASNPCTMFSESGKEI